MSENPAGIRDCWERLEVQDVDLNVQDATFLAVLVIQ